VPFNRFIASIFFSAVVFAQMPHAAAKASFSGEVQSDGSTRLNTLLVELYDLRSHVVVDRTSVSSDGSFRFTYGNANSLYAIRVVTAPGATPLVEEPQPMGNNGSPVVLRLPEQKTNQPPAGIVSVHQLQHPIPKQALRALVEAQQYSARDTAKAIAKLELAIRIAPTSREAHANLGVQYARAGRMDEAAGQFQAALAIGPPDVLIYTNLTLAMLALNQYREAEEFAQKALSLEPENARSQRLLRYAAAHARSLAVVAQ
jgi:tetratricopeptide (TPR) repeat protein